MHRLSLFFAGVLLLAACVPTSAPANQPPTPMPFPTMTPGRYLRGVLAAPLALPLNGSNLANPATAVAMASRPTATPDYTACPALGSPALDTAPDTRLAMVEAMTRFLSNGGAAATLESRLRAGWDVLGETGIVRADLDLTGEGTTDILITFNSPDEGGAVAIFTCTNQRYSLRYENVMGGTAPRIIQIGDMTFDGKPEVLFTSRVCDEEDRCQFRTQLIGWRPDLGRFVSLLGRDIESDSEPSIGDVDDDRVVEIVVRLDSPGNAQTGPLRTGVNIYDWNGGGYVRSIVQLDPPRFRIQIVHLADRALARLNGEEAVSLYQFAFDDAALQEWYPGETPILRSYVLYRLLLTRAYLAEDDLLSTYQTILDTFPDPDNSPPFVRLSIVFWNAFQITNNLRSACLEVRELIETQPEILDLLNRYGERSPIYSGETVCPL